MSSAASYLHSEGLHPLLESPSTSDERRNPPDVEDLVRLHRLVRGHSWATILEFGVGYSTLVLADALEKNRREASERERHRPFRVFAVDASERWIEDSRRRIPASLQQRVELLHSPVRIGTFAGQLCHFYERLPDIVPDFVYLDGPDPADVQGSIRGVSFQCPERTPMAADLLFLEPTLLPGTMILVDGRTNNARFLARNFRRRFAVNWDPQDDVTTFELQEPPLSKRNGSGSVGF